ncbi:hypothetical protein S83_054978 [Arachis hypogaea]
MQAWNLYNHARIWDIEEHRQDFPRLFLLSYGATSLKVCNYFVWLDEMISKHFGHEDDNDIEGRMMMLENRLEQLEYNIELGIEGKSKKWRNRSCVVYLSRLQEPNRSINW